MRYVDIKGVRFGAGRPKTIVSLMGDSRSRDWGFDADRIAMNPADGMEWRADYNHNLNPDALAGTCFFLSGEYDLQPLIFTCRTAGQGGKADLTPQEYADVCRTSIELGAPDVVDLELAAGESLVRELIAAAREHGVRTMVSLHDFKLTPDTGLMRDLFLMMSDLDADLCKLAVMAHDEQDCERLMEATRQAHLQLGEERDRPFCAIAMGEAGRRSRLEGELFGSALTFCALGTASAPGQVELSEAISAMDEIHRRLA